jgi:WD40 repeat protein
MTAFEPTHAKLATSCEVAGILYALCWDAEHSLLYGAGSDRSVYRVDLHAEKPTAEKCWTHHGNYVSALELREGTLISAGYDRQIIWADLESGKMIRSVTAHEGWVRNLKVLPDGKRLASVGDDMLVKLWDAESGKQLDSFDGHARQSPQGYATALYALAVSPDGKYLASGDRVGVVCLWETETGKLMGQLQAPTFYTYDPVKRVRSIGGIRSLSFSPDGSTLAIGGIGQVTNVDGFVGPCRIELWDWQAEKRISTCQDKHNAIFNDLTFHPTEPWLIAGGGGDSGGILAFWDRQKDELNHKAKPKGHLQRLILDVPENRLLAAGHNGFQIWNFDDADSDAKQDE